MPEQIEVTVQAPSEEPVQQIPSQPTSDEPPYEEGLGVSEEPSNSEGNAEDAREAEQPHSDEELNAQLEANAKESQTVAAFLASHGIDYEALVEEYGLYGHLTENTYAKFDKAGLPRSMVNSYCAGQEALYGAWKNSVKSIAGGDEAYTALMQFAQENLTDAEKEAYDYAVNSGDISAAKMAVEALMYRYEQQHPSDGYNYEGSDNTGASTAEGFRTFEEAVKAREDPRMYTDPEYTRAFNARLMKSAFLKQ